eukprot:c15880_g1_i4.p2 GENE.c15880_g1_i4~~c15880_g1_i4.p2  ORF type:complete len:145 (+),score=45.97 c15880_g1_i4:282-716(+)
MLGAAHVIGVDIDPDALDVFQANLAEFEMDEESIELCLMDLAAGGLRPGKFVDTVVMNPPFGTRNKGIDSTFVETAISMCRGAVYSLHKTSTRDHFARKAVQWGVGFEAVAELRFDIPAMYSFHRKQTKDVCVDLLRFDCSRKP